MPSLMRSLVDGFRWWMIPALLLLFGGILGLGLLASWSSISPTTYTAW